jgi:hypothetical protein
MFSFSLRNSFLPDLGPGLFAGSVPCDPSASKNPSPYTVIVDYNTTSDVKQFLARFPDRQGVVGTNLAGELITSGLLLAG